MKKKKQTGEIEEVPKDRIFPNSDQKMEEEPYKPEEDYEGEF